MANLLLLLLISFGSDNGAENNESGNNSVSVTVPDVVGQAQTAAQREITSAGLTMVRVTQEYSFRRGRFLL